MADQGWSDFIVVFTMSLCGAGLKHTLISLTALNLGIQVLRSYLKVVCEYELHTLPNTKVSTAKDRGENFMKVRPPLVRHLSCNRLMSVFVFGENFKAWFT